jgi:hypothetical protein
MFESGAIGLVGGVYNVEDGRVDFFKNLTRKDPQNASFMIKETLNLQTNL